MIDNNITTSGNLKGIKTKAGEMVKLQRKDKIIIRSKLDYLSNKSSWDLKGFKIAEDKVKEVKEVKEVKKPKEDKKEVKKEIE